MLFLFVTRTLRYEASGPPHSSKCVLRNQQMVHWCETSQRLTESGEAAPRHEYRTVADSCDAHKNKRAKNVTHRWVEVSWTRTRACLKTGRPAIQTYWINIDRAIRLGPTTEASWSVNTWAVNNWCGRLCSDARRNSGRSFPTEVDADRPEVTGRRSWGFVDAVRYFPSSSPQSACKRRVGDHWW